MCCLVEIPLFSLRKNDKLYSLNFIKYCYKCTLKALGIKEHYKVMIKKLNNT